MPSTAFTDYRAVQDYLFGLKVRGVKFGIDRMRSWIEAIGHPEKAIPCIHITGTNGKGSTAAMLDSIFRGVGWRTGLYTSPHLVRLGERVQVDRVSLSPEEIVGYTNELKPIAEEISKFSPEDHPSFFEFMTAMAFLQFQRKHCDISLIEVGMGGRLDATNVVDPEISVITSISLDHCEVLGDSVEKIAREKGGIIKPGRPVVIGHVPPEAERVLREIAAEQAAPVRTIAEEFGTEIGGYPRTNLEGDYQRWNAAIATLVTRLMPSKWNLAAASVESALQRVDWAGRWQRLRLGNHNLVLDASHNPEGAAGLDEQLKRLVRDTGRAPIVVTGILGAARARPLIETICRHAREVYFVAPHQSRACGHAELLSLVPKDFRGKVHCSSVAEIFPGPQGCTIGSENDVVVVTGSIYLLGEVLARLQPDRGAIEEKLQDF